MRYRIVVFNPMNIPDTENGERQINALAAEGYWIESVTPLNMQPTFYQVLVVMTNAWRESN